MQSIKTEKSESGVLSLIFDRSDSNANTVDDLFTNEFSEAIDVIVQDPPRGILMRSAKTSFFAGGDLDQIYRTTMNEARSLFDMVERLKSSMRKLETLGIPVVACIEGAALGGGFELALLHLRFCGIS